MPAAHLALRSAQLTPLRLTSLPAAAAPLPRRHVLPHIACAKSPQAVMGSLVKQHWAPTRGLRVGQLCRGAARTRAAVFPPQGLGRLSRPAAAPQALTPIELPPLNLMASASSPGRPRLFYVRRPLPCTTAPSCPATTRS